MKTDVETQLKLTIAICTRNRAPFLEKCLEGLREQFSSALGTPILIIDNGSTDNTRIVCERYVGRFQLLCIAEPRIGLSHARNTALANCKTEYIVFLDDDGIPASNWLEAINKGIEKFTPDIFGGPYTPYYVEPKPKWFLDEFGSAHTDDADGGVNFPYCFSGGNMGWRVSMIQNMGGFDPELGMSGNTLGLGEETALQMELWKRINLIRVLFPEMHMAHYVSPNKMTLSYIAKRSLTYGKQLRQIDPANPLLNKSLIQTLLMCKFGFPLVLRLLFRNRTTYPYWKTYAAKFLSLHCIGLGVAWAARDVRQQR